MSFAVSADEAQASLTRHPFAFKGEAGAYFAICLRTVLLAVVTLGIYDAWGTVERRRYRMGNTVVAGHGFDYHASPVVILIGRFIAVGVIVALQIVLNFAPPNALVFIGPLAFALFFFGIPYIVLRSFRFHLRNTSYRNVRFDFTGTYGSAFFVLSIAPFVVGLTLGIAYPWYQAKFQEFALKNVRLGRARFDVDVPLAPLYKAFAIMLLIAVPATAALGAGVGFWFVNLMESAQAGAQPPPELAMVIFGAMIVFMLLMYFLSFILRAALRNAVLRNLWLQGGHRFDSNVTAFRFGWMVLSRGLLATVSLGLLIPWATVQIHRYLMDHTALLANGDLDTFVSRDVDPGGAAVSEFGAMEGISDGVFSGI